MLTGEVVYRHGSKNYRLRPGDSMLFDSGALHGPELLVKRPMTYLSVIIYRDAGPNLAACLLVFLLGNLLFPTPEVEVFVQPGEATFHRH